MQKEVHILRRERVCEPDFCRAPQCGWTPLHLAALNGCDEVVETLLEAEAAKDAKDEVRGMGG